MKMEFGIEIYSQVFPWLSSMYSRMKKFIPIYQIVGFPGERYNLGFCQHWVSYSSVHTNRVLNRYQIEGDYSLQESW
jgi:hypothetical protein